MFLTVPPSRLHRQRLREFTQIPILIRTAALVMVVKLAHEKSAKLKILAVIVPLRGSVIQMLGKAPRKVSRKHHCKLNRQMIELTFLSCFRLLGCGHGSLSKSIFGLQ
jgi:hypothetical protein